MSGPDDEATALSAGVVIGVDTGGTFTDVTMLDVRTGRVQTAKTPSTPDDPSRGFADGVREVLRSGRRAGAEVARVLHGTTVATNLILEGKGARAALLTTRGFKYVLEIGRQDVPRRSSLFAWVKPKRPIRPEHIFEIGGRIGPDGAEIAPLDEGDILAAADEIAGEGITSIAVVLLHSYANGEHERRVGELLRQKLPEAQISLSSSVLPVFREYERSMTTALNASVMPVVSRYVAQLEGRIGDIGITAPLLLMKSNGGVTSAAEVRRAPVETALSGPAAGAVGAAYVGKMAGHPNVIAIDIGGTSADISLIEGAEPGLTTHGRIGGWPVGLPMVDIVTIGAGGGSIARVTASGALSVGPESAGAVPGPVCYGRGGTEPTVTDAHLALGHLPPYLLQGRFKLDVEAARASIETRIAQPLSMTVEQAARGILAIVDNNMVGAIRVVSVERGHDPRDFALLPFGGAGPLHGGALSRLLGMPRIVVPPAPGVLSAFGLLMSDLKAEMSRTCLQRAGDIDLPVVRRVFAELDAEGRAWLRREGVPEEAWRITWSASIRYQNQGFELSVPWSGREVTPDAARETVDAFHRLHERLYTFAQEDTPAEIVTLRVDARGVFPAPEIPEVPSVRSLADARVGEQIMHLEPGPRMTPIYDRARLGAGHAIAGPAIVSQLDATTLVLAGQVARVDKLGNIIIEET